MVSYQSGIYMLDQHQTNVQAYIISPTQTGFRVQLKVDCFRGQGITSFQTQFTFWELLLHIRWQRNFYLDRYLAKASTNVPSGVLKYKVKKFKLFKDKGWYTDSYKRIFYERKKEGTVCDKVFISFNNLLLLKLAPSFQGRQSATLYCMPMALTAARRVIETWL